MEVLLIGDPLKESVPCCTCWGCGDFRRQRTNVRKTLVIHGDILERRRQELILCDPLRDFPLLLFGGKALSQYRAVDRTVLRHAGRIRCRGVLPHHILLPCCLKALDLRRDSLAIHRRDSSRDSGDGKQGHKVCICHTIKYGSWDVERLLYNLIKHIAGRLARVLCHARNLRLHTTAKGSKERWGRRRGKIKKKEMKKYTYIHINTYIYMNKNTYIHMNTCSYVHISNSSYFPMPIVIVLLYILLHMPIVARVYYCLWAVLPLVDNFLLLWITFDKPSNIKAFSLSTFFLDS